jgi:hypothetical protein
MEILSNVLLFLRDHLLGSNATRIMVAEDDGKEKAGWLFKFAGLNHSDYLNASWHAISLPFDANQHNELGKETVLRRILTNAQIYGLTRACSDQYFIIYRRSN